MVKGRSKQLTSQGCRVVHKIPKVKIRGRCQFRKNKNSRYPSYRTGYLNGYRIRAKRHGGGSSRKSHGGSHKQKTRIRSGHGHVNISTAHLCPNC